MKSLTKNLKPKKFFFIAESKTCWVLRVWTALSTIAWWVTLLVRQLKVGWNKPNDTGCEGVKIFDPHNKKSTCSETPLASVKRNVLLWSVFKDSKALIFLVGFQTLSICSTAFSFYLLHSFLYLQYVTFNFAEQTKNDCRERENSFWHS